MQDGPSRLYEASEVLLSSHQLNWSNLANRLSSAFSAVSISTVVVLSMLPLPCGVDDLGLVDV
jgi:hypothetical protein